VGLAVTPARRNKAPPHGRLRRERMKDILFLVITAAFFLLSWLYVRACERV
jgi:hypothetical protein